MTDSERWRYLAQYLEHVGADGLKRFGLCYLITRVYGDDLSVMKRIRLQLWEEYGHLSPNNFLYWPPGEVKPRIEACYRMAEILRDKEQTL